ncbi:MAG: MBL fold metallo-hydrolase [Armatimonadetes bacterium]|nr:MBL fold metallo-hydrolase [Armatimonadota bacterium]MDW8120701.1 MBL fold metallo-hydrolase [Armatimonadota bacterium]
MASLKERIQKAPTLEKGIILWGLGQVGVVIKGGGKTIYIDPYLTDATGTRALPIPIRPEEVTDADLVFISHGHIDHLDPGTIGPLSLASPQALFICPYPCRQMMIDCGVDPSRLVHPIVDRWDEQKGVSFCAIPSAHYSFDEVDGHPSYLGYCLIVNGVRIYHSGDTILYDGLTERIRQFRPHLAFLPINGRDYYRERNDIVGNLTFWEAARLAVEAGVDTVIPTHWDLFDANSENFGRFADWLYHNARSQKFHVLHIGEAFVYLPDA